MLWEDNPQATPVDFMDEKTKNQLIRERAKKAQSPMLFVLLYILYII